MGGALMQLVAYGAKDIYLFGNPQCGVPLYGHSEGRILNSNPTCSLEFTWIEKSIENKIDYTTFFTSDYAIGNMESADNKHKYYQAGDNVEIVTPKLDKDREKTEPIIIRRKKIKIDKFIPNDNPFQTINTVDDAYVKEDHSKKYYSQILEKFENDRIIKNENINQ